MIPQEKSAAVTLALREAFGVTEFEDVRKMTKGHDSALVLRIVVRGSPFLLRIIVRPNAILGPTREFTCIEGESDELFAYDADERVYLQEYFGQPPMIIS